MAKLAINRTIVQYLPANGWYATYDNLQECRRIPLACWGLTDDGEMLGIVFWQKEFQSAESVQSSWMSGKSFEGYEAS